MPGKPSVCRGRRIRPAPPDYWRYECDWFLCPINYPDDTCWFRLEDDDPNPHDYQPPDADHAA